MITVVSLRTPESVMSFWNCIFERMSRTVVSQSCVFQAHAIAPGTCPSSYALVSTSTSTTQTFLSFPCSVTHWVVTRTSGCAYSAILYSLLFDGRGGGCD